MTAFLAAMIFVVLAEMGDKTQLLALALAGRYSWKTVMSGILVATLLNHLLAVLVGHYLQYIMPMMYVQIAAAVSFIFFGIWTIRGDELGDADKAACYTPFCTVVVAFFLAEMGDKTQLATVALAAQYQEILPVWMGTTTGMMIADGMAIVVGGMLLKRLPEEGVKWTAAIIFVLFGLYGLYEALPAPWNTPAFLGVVAVVSAILMGLVHRWQCRESQESNSNS